MDTKLVEIRPLVTESWVRQRELDQQMIQSQQVHAKAKSQGSDLGHLDHKKHDLYSLDAEPNKNLEAGDIEGLVQDVEEYLSEMNVDLSFKVQRDTGEVVVKVLNRSTGDVIRQLPPEDVLTLREKLKELRGLLFEKKV